MSNVNQARDSRQPPTLRQFVPAAQDTPGEQGSTGQSGGSQMSYPLYPKRVAGAIDLTADSNDDVAEGYTGLRDRESDLGSTVPTMSQQFPAAKGKGRRQDDLHGLRGSFFKKPPLPRLGDDAARKVALTPPVLDQTSGTADIRRDKWEPDELEEMYELKQQGWSNAQVGGRLRRGASAVESAYTRYRASKSERTEDREAYASISRRRDQGFSFKDIAQQQKQPESTVFSNFRKGERFQHKSKQETLDRLVDLKENQGKSWEEIHDHIPELHLSALKGRYYKAVRGRKGKLMDPTTAATYSDDEHESGEDLVSHSEPDSESIEAVTTTSGALESLTLTSGATSQDKAGRMNDDSKFQSGDGFPDPPGQRPSSTLLERLYPTASNGGKKTSSGPKYITDQPPELAAAKAARVQTQSLLKPPDGRRRLTAQSPSTLKGGSRKAKSDLLSNDSPYGSPAPERTTRPTLPSVSPQKRSTSSDSSKTRAETPIPKKSRQ